MILIDTNTLLVFLVGLMNPALIERKKRIKMYNAEDFENLLSFITSKIGNDYQKIITLPNVWTEVDNLLNHANLGIDGGNKFTYIQELKKLIFTTTEQYFFTNPIHFTPSWILFFTKPTHFALFWILFFINSIDFMPFWILFFIKNKKILLF